MWDFSGDEAAFFMIAGAFGFIGFVFWYAMLLRVSSLGRPRYPRAIVAATPVLALALLFVVLWNWADPVFVAGHLDYTLLFMAGGAAWLVATHLALPLFGLSTRDDVVERGNSAAAVAVCGALLGVMLVYALANIGNGPTIWTTLIPALVATAALLALWAVVESAAGGIAEAITVDRDVASALRLAAFLVAAGAVIGRAMAGDWHDWRGTFVDFARLAWPAVVLALLAAVAHRIGRPTPSRPMPSVVACGVVPGVVILILALTYLVMLGPPEVAPVPR